MRRRPREISKVRRFGGVVLAACAACGILGCEKFKAEPAQQPQQQTLSPESKLSPEQKLALAEKCSKAGRSFYETYRSSNMPDGFLWDEPQFHYNARLGTCLLQTRFVRLAGTTSFHQNAVIDIFANKVLLRGDFERDVKSHEEKLWDVSTDNAPNFTSTTFIQRAESLMAE